MSDMHESSPSVLQDIWSTVNFGVHHSRRCSGVFFVCLQKLDHRLFWNLQIV